MTGLPACLQRVTTFWVFCLFVGMDGKKERKEERKRGEFFLFFVLFFPLSFEREQKKWSPRNKRGNPMTHLLLHARHVLHRDLRAQVPPRHHHRVRCLDDLGQVGHRVERLDLGDDFDRPPGFSAARREVRLEVVDHVGALDERHGDEVDLLREGKVDVEPVLGGQHGQHAVARAQDAAAAAEGQVGPREHQARLDDDGEDVGPGLRDDLQGDHAAVDDDGVPGLDVVDETVVRDADDPVFLVLAALVALGDVADGERELGPRLGLERFLQLSRVHLGTLGVDHDGHAVALFLVEPADRVDDRGVPLVRAVAHVQPRDVHPPRGELSEDLGRAGGRPDGADDLGAAGGAEA